MLRTPCPYTARYYWTKDDLYIRAVNAEFIYGYEYLGNSGRLTPYGYIYVTYPTSCTVVF